MDEQNARAMIMDEIVVGLAQQDGAAMRGRSRRASSPARSRDSRPASTEPGTAGRTGGTGSHPGSGRSTRRSASGCGSTGGAAVELAAELHGNWSRHRLARAGSASRQVQVPTEVLLVLLMSDGVSDQVPQELLTRLCHEHAADLTTHVGRHPHWSRSQSSRPAHCVETVTRQGAPRWSSSRRRSW